MIKKWAAFALSAAMTVSLLAGCGNHSANASAKNTSDEDETATGKVYYLNANPKQDQAWKSLAKEYKKETGIPVKIVTAEEGKYNDTLTKAMNKTDGTPTLFQVNGPMELSTWQNDCYDLSKSDVYGQLTADNFALKDEDGGVDGIAYALETYGIIYNKALLNKAGYTQDDITNFATLKKAADDIQTRKSALGVKGAFTFAGTDESSNWKTKAYLDLANLPIYYEYQANGVTSSDAIKGTYLDNFKQLFDLYLKDSTCSPSEIFSKTTDQANAEFSSGEAVFYQSGTWAYDQIKKVGDDNLGMLPIYIGVEGEQEQGLCTGSENYWCVNKNASEEDIQATLDFMNWCVTSEKGTSALANKMGLSCPFQDAKENPNPLVKIADQYVEDGKTSVDWCFSTMPSETWRNNLGSALKTYAAGGDWNGVKTAFVDSWASEIKANSTQS